MNLRNSFNLLFALSDIQAEIASFIDIKIRVSVLSGCLFGCLFVCLCPINVKTDEPVGPNFFGGTSGDPREG